MHKALPRWGEFTPDARANIYADEVALLLIACQNCGREFKVSMECGVLDRVRGRETLADEIRDGSIHYGDPPNVGCCPAGPTMNCLDLRVLEYWHKVDFKWARDGALEIVLPDGKETEHAT